MAVSIADCKRFAGVVGNDDDLVMTLCLESAQEYMAASGVPESTHESSRYALCAYMLASHYFDHRSAIGDTQAVAVPGGVTTLIFQLKGEKGAEAHGTA